MPEPLDISYIKKEAFIVDENVNEDKGVHDSLAFPGDELALESEYMRGLNTFIESAKIHSSVIGVKENYNKLVCVNSLSARFVGSIGDLVIGRIIRSETKKWIVDINSRRSAVLLLSSINLPGGELKRRDEHDQQKMTLLLSSHDLILAEIQNVMDDGVPFLHTRSLRYGKLPPGTMIKVPPKCIKRTKSQLCLLLDDIACIFALNGFIWLGSKDVLTTDLSNFELTNNFSILTKEQYLKIAKIKNCICALYQYNISLHPASVCIALECAEEYNTNELIKPETAQILAKLTYGRLARGY